MKTYTPLYDNMPLSRGERPRNQHAPAQCQSGRATSAAPSILPPGAPLANTVRSRFLRRVAIGLLAAGNAACEGSPIPTTLERYLGDAQVAPVGTQLPVVPAVRVFDQDGRAMPGVDVTFAVTEGGGTVVVPDAVTDGLGIASPFSWTLGTTSGVNALTASVDGLPPIRFVATATSGPPSGLSKQTGDAQVARVGERVATRPAVRATDRFGNPTPGLEVVFFAAAGGGAAEGATQLTDADGLATVGGWQLGTRPGVNQLAAVVAGGPSATFTAEALPGPPSAILKLQGDGQVAPVSTPLLVRPAVLVFDPFGNVVPGVEVNFAVSQGGGSVGGGAVSTDAEGIAVVASWTMGSEPGTNVLEARIAGLQPLSFSAIATAPPPGSVGFDIELRFLSGLSPGQQAVAREAALRWESVIVGNLTSLPIQLSSGACGTTHPGLNQTVDDLFIFISAVPIDGPNGTLGSAGPCLIRNVDGLPILGVIEIDIADLALLEAEGALAPVMLHEIGHVLGFGTLWEQANIIVGAAGIDPYFTGPMALSAFDAAGGTGFAGNKVPVENTGGPGTRDAHWRESVFRNELMTGFFDLGQSNPLSRVSLGSLVDLGYQVDLSQAEAFLLPLPLAGSPGRFPRLLEIIERQLPPPISVGPETKGVGPPAPG